MNRTDFTYGQLDTVLRSLGFTMRHHTADAPPTNVYEHPTGALILLPPYPATDKVLENHLVTVRGTLDDFGIADPTTLAAKLQKAG